MKENIIVSEVMQTKLITLHPKDTLERVKEIFESHKIHHIPIVVMNKIVGVVSLGDFLFFNKINSSNYDKFLSNNSVFTNTVEEIMTLNPICAHTDHTLNESIKLMLKNRINCLPVLKNERLVGILTTYDLMNLLKNINNNKR